MRSTWTRNSAAAWLFVVFGIALGALAVLSSSLMLAVVACVALIAAAASTRGFPIDRNW